MATKQILEYVGPFQGEVHVNLAAGPTTTKDRQIEVDGADAASLLEQPDNWQPAKKKGA